MRYHQLRESVYTPSHDINEVKEKYERQISEYRDRGEYIYRGMRYFNYPMLANGNILNRASRNTYNFYTLLIDSSDAWKDYPKRSKSFICTTDETYAFAYSEAPKFYTHVIPLENQPIALAPANDFWLSFSPFMHAVSEFFGKTLYDLPDFTFHLKKVLTKAGITPSETNAKQLRVSIEQYSPELLKIIDDNLTPEQNHFKLFHNIHGFAAKEKREVWLSGLVLLIPKPLEIDFEL